MQSPISPSLPALQAAFLENREKLLRFLLARGAGEEAEDLLQEVWLKVARPGRDGGPVRAPLSYLFQVANALMIDRYRSRRQSALRESNWAESSGTDLEGDQAVPTPERILAGRDLLSRVDRAIDQAGQRVATVFRRHRVEGIPQREIATELGVSLSTIESDLRTAYRIIAELREQSDEA